MPISRGPDEDGEFVYEVLSGNHRVKAAIDAGLKNIEFMVTHQPLSHQQRTAIKLSHNSITGEDDPKILKELFDTLDTDFKLYSGLDDKKLQQLLDTNAPALSLPTLEYQTMAIIFLPDELEEVKRIYEKANAAIKSLRPKIAWLNRMSDYDQYLDLMEDTSTAYGVKNAATTLLLLLTLAERHLDELDEGWLNKEGEFIASGVTLNQSWPPLSSIFGRTRLPARQAKTVRQAVEIMVSRGEIAASDRYQALELWAKDYLERNTKQRPPKEPKNEVANSEQNRDRDRGKNKPSEPPATTPEPFQALPTSV